MMRTRYRRVARETRIAVLAIFLARRPAALASISPATGLGAAIRAASKRKRK